MTTTPQGTPFGLVRPWVIEPGVVAEALGTDLTAGLSAAEAEERLARVGPNELLERGRKPTWRLFVEQFTNTMIIVLMIAALVTRGHRRPQRTPWSSWRSSSSTG